MNFVVRRIDQMEGSHISSRRGRPRKTIKRDLEMSWRHVFIFLFFFIEHYGVV